MQKKRWLIICAVIVLLSAAGFFVYSQFLTEKDFTKTSLIKVNIPTDGEYEISVKITNPEQTEQLINFSINNFNNIATFSDSEFYLQPGESQNLIISFKDNIHTPEVYVGKLIIRDSVSKEEIPVILGVEDSNSAFAIIPSVLPKYDSVYPGDKFGIDLKVFDLKNSNVPTVKANYEIKNLDGETILNGETEIAVDDGGKTEIINIPKDWGTGDYVFVITINYKDTISFSSYLFSISSLYKKNFLSEMNFILMLVILFVVIIIGLVIYFITARDSLFIRLRRQQSQEIRRNLKCIAYSRRAIRKSREKPAKKKEKIRRLNRVKKKIIRRIREKQRRQKREISRLRKIKAKRNTLDRKLQGWKKQGYKMYEAKEELHGTNIQKQLGDWKKQGYKI
ncbi:MAG: hypothetical protein PHQ66_02005 [Candidatus Nanoarchaeia archaeon]|nr:hypothetical protein [Candidatus Nanoarchaeia archaeon]MDD5357854.1 hypothetical protein [Candidatus Nanoarchaeia archaeon]MDD5588773.1 hypothetical protein [Candidatus Nanoarchaeia archaeon]